MKIAIITGLSGAGKTISPIVLGNTRYLAFPPTLKEVCSFIEPSFKILDSSTHSVSL